MTMTRTILAALMAVVPTKPKFLHRTPRRDSWPRWADDPVGYWPVHDRGGAMSEFAGSDDGGMLGVLAQIELNEDDGRTDLGHGLPDDALVPRSR